MKIQLSTCLLLTVIFLSQSPSHADPKPDLLPFPILTTDGHIFTYENYQTPHDLKYELLLRNDHYVCQLSEDPTVGMPESLMHAHNFGNTFRSGNVFYRFCEMGRDEDGYMIELRIAGSWEDDSIIIEDAGASGLWAFKVNGREVCKFRTTDERTKFDLLALAVDFRGTSSALDLVVNLATSEFLYDWLYENIDGFRELLNIDTIRGVTVINVSLGEGADSLVVENASDEPFHAAFVVNAGSGDDFLFLDTTGGCIAYGDVGDDFITTYGKSEISGGPGDDTISCHGTENHQIFGDDGDDTLMGGDGDDLIIGGGEDLNSRESDDDYIDGLGGEDTLFGGPGSDKIFAGNDSDDDRIITGTGIDEVCEVGKEDWVRFRQWQSYAQPGDSISKSFDDIGDDYLNWLEQHCEKIFTDEEDQSDDVLTSMAIRNLRMVDPERYPWMPTAQQ